MSTPNEIWNEVVEAAKTAITTCVPKPMGVVPVNFMTGKALGPVEIVNEGMCGFAHVNIKPARGPFIKFLKENDIGYSDSYYGGYSISMSMFTGSQSIERKEAAGRAVVQVLKKHGMERVYMSSRLD